GSRARWGPTVVPTPAILTLLKAAGLDFARVDMEHSTPSMETIADMALLARGLAFPIAVRPAKACSAAVFGTCIARRWRTPGMRPRSLPRHATRRAGFAATPGTVPARTMTPA